MEKQYFREVEIKSLNIICLILRSSRNQMFSYLPKCWLEVIMQLEGPATGYLDIAFLVFFCFQALAEMVSKFLLAITSTKIILLGCQSHQIIFPYNTIPHSFRK
jgi:hypothetical protein